MAAFTLAAFLRLLLSIVSMSFALIVLNFTTVSPLKTLESLRRAIRDARSAATGALRLVFGCVFGFWSLANAARTSPAMTQDLLSSLAVAIVLTALVVEALVGESIRRQLGFNR